MSRYANILMSIAELEYLLKLVEEEQSTDGDWIGIEVQGALLEALELLGVTNG